MKNFDRDNLELVEEESLTEKVITEDVDSDGAQEFKTSFIGKKGIFKGLDYGEIFFVREQENGTYDFSPEDKAEIEVYKSLEGKECAIRGCTVNGWEPWLSEEESFTNSLWDIDFEDGTILNAIPGSAVDFSDPETLHESLDDAATIRREADKKNKDNDIIAPFVYRDYGDEKPVPTWTFIGPIMNYYGADEETIFNFCKEYGHKVWCIRGAVVPYKIVIAAKEIKSEDIHRDYGDFVDGYRSLIVEEVDLN